MSSGFTPAAGSPEASQGREDQAAIHPAQLIEGDSLRSHAVGDPEPWSGDPAFLDGVQSWELVGYRDVAPVVAAKVSAAVRLRVGRKFSTALERRRRILISRPEVMEDVDLLGWEPILYRDERHAHVVGDVSGMRALVEGARTDLELALRREFQTKNRGWLVMDGAISHWSDTAASTNLLGVIKSHASLPFDGEALSRYLHLPFGCRTSVFRPAAKHDVYSWAVRLWPWEGKDLLYGLVRVEAAPTPDTIAQADQISRWLLHERAPISTPDARWDRLLYGIHDVERYLKAKN